MFLLDKKSSTSFRADFAYPLSSISLIDFEVVYKGIIFIDLDENVPNSYLVGCLFDFKTMIVF